MKRRYCLAISLILTALVFVAPGARGSTVEIGVNAPKKAKPGDLVTNVFTVKNTGGASDTYDLTLSTPSGWSVLGTVPASLSLNAEDSQKFFITVIVPKTAVAQEYEVGLTAESQSVPGDSAEANSTVLISAIPKVEAEWVREPPRTEPGGSSTGMFSLANSGNVSDVYTIEVDTSNCDVSLADNRVQVFPGETRRIEVDMNLPKSLSPGSEYSFYFEISSRKHPDVTARLRHSNSAAPPPPEEVGGTVYPLWPVTVSLSGNEGGDFSLGVSGSGELGDIGSLSASTTITPEEFQKPTGSFSSEDWSISLGGGGVSGGFGGVSGEETAVSMYGKLPQKVSTQLVLSEDTFGASGRIDWDGGSLRIVEGRQSESKKQYSEAQISHDFPGPFSITGSLANVATQTESGTAFVVSSAVESSGYGLAVESSGYSFVGDILLVSPGFPGRDEERTYSLTANFTGNIPLGLSASLSRVTSEEESEEVTTETHSFTFNTALPISESIDMELDGDFEHQESYDSPKSTKITEWVFQSEVAGSYSQEGEFSIGFTFSETRDYVAGSNYMETGVFGSLGLSLGSVEMDFSTELSEVINLNTGEVENESSTVAMNFNFPSLSEGVDISMEIEDSATWALSLSRPINETGEFTGSITVPFAGEGEYSVSLSVKTPTIFDFFGPIKSRVKGKAFVDINGNGVYDKSEKPVSDLLLTLTPVTEEGLEVDKEKQAISGENGNYNFWPVEPGRYSMDVAEVPFGVQLEKEFPLTLDIKKGKVNIPVPTKRYSAITGKVYRDEDQNKEMSQSEQGVAGVTVLIRGTSGTIQAETGPSGSFFERVEPGTYTVEIMQDSLPDRFVPTTSANVSVNVSSREKEKVDFGVYKKPKDVVFTFGPPEVKFTYVPEEIVIGEEVTFDASESKGVGDRIKSYVWRFEKGDLSFTAQGEKVKVNFSDSGKWNVMLVVKDEANMKTEKSTTVTVHGKDDN